MGLDVHLVLTLRNYLLLHSNSYKHTFFEYSSVVMVNLPVQDLSKYFQPIPHKQPEMFEQEFLSLSKLISAKERFEAL